jgi:hypothetical protein
MCAWSINRRGAATAFAGTALSWNRIRVRQSSSTIVTYCTPIPIRLATAQWTAS